MTSSDLSLVAQEGGIVFIVALLLCRLLISINIAAVPLSRSSHHIPTPSAGGLGIIFSFIVGFIIEVYRTNSPLPYSRSIIPYIISLLLIGGISFMDDCRPISYRVRLFVHLLGSLVIVTSSGMLIKFPAFSFLNDSLFAQALTVFSLVSLINATNFLDGLNGLLGGTTFLTLGCISLMFPFNTIPSILSLLLMPAILGFLIFNFPKGKIFMGDIGSTFFGLTLGFIALSTQKNVTSVSETAWIDKGFILSLTPMAFLWFDVGFTLIRRAFLKRRLTEPHRDHLFHLIYDKGYSHLFVSNLYLLTVIIMGGLSLTCYYSYISFTEMILIYTLLQAGLCWWVFKGVPHAMGR